MKRILLLLFVFGLMWNTAFAIELSDVQNHWAKESIYRLIEADAINGYEDGTFMPENAITIAEFLKMIVQYADYKKVLEGERWPDWYINTAKNEKIILEDEFDNYDQVITRKEAVRILARWIDIKEIKKGTKKFKDTSDDIAQKLLNVGVISGYEDQTFRGNNNVTRAEASVMICRAMRVKRNLVANKKYDLKNAERLTNINRTPSYLSDYRNRYEVKNNKIYFYDDGRYAPLDGYAVDDKNIENKKLVKLIQSLIQEDAYVAVSYIPDKQLYDQITIEYGRREGYVYNHSYAFCFTFYPDKQFELRKSSLNENLSEECFMKIIIGKMWKDAYDLKNGEFTHELNNEKLLKALKTLFDERTANGIYQYIQEWIPKLYNEGQGNRFTELKKIGKYEVNLYTSGNSRVQLYISK